MPESWATRSMSPSERKLWRQIRSRVAHHTPEMQRAVERSFDSARLVLSEAEVRRLLETARTEVFVNSLVDDATAERIFNPARARLIADVQAAANAFVLDLPGGGRLSGASISVFNLLNANVRRAVRRLDSRVMSSLTDELRETLREATRVGLENGEGSRAVARRVRSAIGLAPNQVRAIENFRRKLREGDLAGAFRNKLRDKRFDRTLRRLIREGGSLSRDQVDRMTAAYRRRWLRHNSEIHARTAMNDAQRLGKHLATLGAIENGILPRDKMFSRWSSSGDDRVRPTHDDPPEGVHGQVVRFGDPFATGDVIPGASEWGCRCIKVDFIHPGNPVTEPPPLAPAPPARTPEPIPEPIPEPTPAPEPTPPEPDDYLPRVTGKRLSDFADRIDGLDRAVPDVRSQIADGIATVFDGLGGARLASVGWSGKASRIRFPRNANAIYAWHNPTAPGHIVVKQKYARAAERFGADARETFVRNRAIVRSRLEEQLKNPTEAIRRRARQRLDALDANPADRWTVYREGEELFITAAHEAGHGVYYQRGLAARWSNELAAANVTRADRLRVSEYAATDASELFAEVTAEIAANGHARLPASILEAWLNTTADLRRR